MLPSTLTNCDLITRTKNSCPFIDNCLVFFSSSTLRFCPGWLDFFIFFGWSREYVHEKEGWCWLMTPALKSLDYGRLFPLLVTLISRY